MSWFKRKVVEPEPSLQEQLVDAQAHLARVKELPISAFTPRIQGPNTPFIGPHSVDRKDTSIAYAKADIAELETKIRLSQQDTPKTVSQKKSGKIAKGALKQE